MAKAMWKKREENGSQSAKTDRDVLDNQRDEERRFQDALEHDELREELKLSHARDKERMRKEREENCEALLVSEQQRQFQDVLEDDEVREELNVSYARDKPRLACDRR